MDLRIYAKHDPVITSSNVKVIKLVIKTSQFSSSVALRVDIRAPAQARGHYPMLWPIMQSCGISKSPSQVIGVLCLLH